MHHYINSRERVESFLDEWRRSGWRPSSGVRPAESPKLHGSVERANRTHTEEFYEVTDAEPDLAALEASGRTRPWAT